MIRRRTVLWQIAGFVFASAAGVLLHFLYDWSGNAVAVAPFSGINESTFEHMKLLFWPLFLFSWAESRMLRKRYEHFWCIKLVGTLTGLLLIPIIYYTYTGALGVSADWFNITIFFLAAATTFLLETRLFKKDDLVCLPNFLSLVLLWILAAAFVIFTFWPPKIPLFQDPETLQYGI